MTDDVVRRDPLPTCPECGSEALTAVEGEGDGGTVGCDVCGLTFVPVVDPAATCPDCGSDALTPVEGEGDGGSVGCDVCGVRFVPVATRPQPADDPTWPVAERGEG